MLRSLFLVLILTFCTLTTCGIIPFLGSAGLGEEFESAKSRKCRKEEHDRCFNEVRICALFLLSRSMFSVLNITLANEI